jgi:acyl-CoA dehydrogenase
LIKGANRLISFRPTEEEAAFAEVAEQFAREHIRPTARECEKARVVHEGLIRQAQELGLLVLELPESVGGLELPLVSQVQVLERLAWGDLGTVQGLPGLGDAAPVLRLTARHPLTLAYGEGADREAVAWLDAAAAEMSLDNGVSAVSEGAAVRLTGLSRPVRLAVPATRVLVSARTDAGETVVAWLDNDAVKWQSEPGDVRLGLLAAGIARLRFDDTKVPADLILARGAEAEALLERVRARVAVLEAAKTVGVMRAALEYAVEYTAQRKAFGQEIAKFQGVSFTAADMAIETEAARNLVLMAAWMLDKGDASGIAAARRALAYALRAARFVTDNGVQLLGGSGYVQEYPVEKWMRDAQAQAVLYGREGDLFGSVGAAVTGHGGKGGAQ